MKPKLFVIFRGLFLGGLLMSGLAACSGQGPETFQGYVEGDFAYMGSSQGGHLLRLAVKRGDVVKTSDLLFQLENTPELAQREQAAHELQVAQANLADELTGKRPDEIDVARAQLADAKAQAVYSSLQFKRNSQLYKKGVIAKVDFDSSRASYESDKAHVEQMVSQIKSYELPNREEQIRAQQAAVKSAEENLRRAEWTLSQKEIAAPGDGLVYDTIYVEGEWVDAGRPVVKMLSPENVKIRFFVPETILGRLQHGQKLRLDYDGAPAPVQVAIDFISDEAEYTPPVIYSNETRNKLIFLIEARPLSLEDAKLLHPGQPVTVSLETARDKQ